MRRSASVGVRAAVVAGTVSGVPSTVHALATRRSVLRALRAAGEPLGRPGFARGVLVHTIMTIGWTTVLLACLPRRWTALWGALGGLLIAGLALAVADRRFPVIASLPRLPQVADHVLFGALVGAVAGRAQCSPR